MVRKQLRLNEGEGKNKGSVHDYNGGEARQRNSMSKTPQHDAYLFQPTAFAFRFATYEDDAVAVPRDFELVNSAHAATH